MNRPTESVEHSGGVQRCYVLKKPGYDPEGADVLAFLRNQLGCKTVTGVRSATRYDVEGVDQQTFSKASSSIFAEAPVDILDDEAGFSEHAKGSTVIGVEALPGQYDQCADFAAQCVGLMGVERPTVNVSTMFMLEGTIDEPTLHKLKTYLINPTDSRESSRELPATLKQKLAEPAGVRILEDFTSLDDDQLNALRKELGLAMTLPDIQGIRTYFEGVKRDPTIMELRVLDTFWSDHCRHTTFTTELLEVALGGKTLLQNGKWLHAEAQDSPEDRAIANALNDFVRDRNRLYADKAIENPLSLMDIALFSMKEAKRQGRLNDLYESEENNAATIVVPVHFDDGRTEKWLFGFKNETHNHPTGIEPYGGAATCLGGCIRDPLSGRMYVFAAMRVSGNGDPRQPIESTRPGKLPQRQIATVAAAGHASYGNQIGVPALKVTSHFHPGYEAKPLEAGFVMAAAKAENVVSGTPKPGDRILLVGGRTGRDGIGGASGSSKEHTTDSLATCGAEVQKGSPPTERALQRFLTNPKVSKKVIRCNDFGAGGVCVAIGELADGVHIRLDDVPLKYLGLDPTEIMTSESQERMAVVISADDYEEFLQYAEMENLEATDVATVTGEDRMVAISKGKEVCNLDRSILKGGWAKREAKPEMRSAAGVSSFFHDMPPALRGKTFSQRWVTNMEQLHVASQRGMQERFDHSVGGNTVIAPFGGQTQSAPSEAGVAAFPTEGVQTAGVAAHGFDVELSAISPFHGAAHAVVDSLARLVATGMSYEKARLTLQNYFAKTDSPERWGDPLLAQLGAREAQKYLVPAIGGKDSMSGSFTAKDGERIDVPPTLISFAAGTMDRGDVIPSHFRQSFSTVVYLPALLDDAGMPQWWQMKEMWSRLHKLMQSGKICSSHAVHTGGVAAAISQMTMGNTVGVDLQEHALPEAEWFTARYGSLVVEVPSGIDPATLFEDSPFVVLGATALHDRIAASSDSVLNVGISSLRATWERPLDDVFPTTPKDRGDGRTVDVKPVTIRTARASDLAPIATPRASVIVFPGNNCEMESARALQAAGADARISVFTNLTRDNIADSLVRLEHEIRGSQIVMFPGGFSAGDHPKGSGKFGAAVLRNPRIADAMQDHIHNRDGLVLGVCNGFQVMVKACLFDDGRVREMTENDPTLAHNGMGRFLSRTAKHKVVSTLSPWLSEFTAGETLDIPIAHGEGRLIHIPDGAFENGCIPLQYVGMHGHAEMLFPSNPNASERSAAGLTDATGRVFGMMAHPERAREGMSVNVIREPKGHKIFEGGVQYYS